MKCAVSIICNIMSFLTRVGSGFLGSPYLTLPAIFGIQRDAKKLRVMGSISSKGNQLFYISVISSLWLDRSIWHWVPSVDPAICGTQREAKELFIKRIKLLNLIFKISFVFVKKLSFNINIILLAGGYSTSSYQLIARSSCSIGIGWTR